MGGLSKTLLAGLASFLFAVSAVACGAGSESSSTEAASQGPPGGNAPAGKARRDRDSGGGSAQFRVQGGDNSIQEFGEEADAAERGVAAAVLHNFLDARAEGEWAAACAFLSKSIAASFEQLAAWGEPGASTGCAAILAELTNTAAEQALKAEAAQADVGSLRMEGERAFIIYRGLDQAPYVVPMTIEDGSWKVASLAGTPLN